MRYYIRIAQVLLFAFSAVPVAAQPVQTIYYSNGNKAMEGRWTYGGRGLVPTSHYDLEANHPWRSLMAAPGGGQMFRMDPDRRTVVPDIVPDGPLTIWDVNGRKIQELSYRKGVPQGAYRQFHPSGRTIVEGDLKHGMLNGLWKRYDSSGELIFSGNFRIHTDQELRDAWEYQFRKTVRDPGQTSGTRRSKRWLEYPQGRPRDSARIAAVWLQPFEQIEYWTEEPAVREGRFRIHPSRGQPTFELYYCNDAPCGTWTVTDTAGKLQTELVFDRNGGLASVRKGSGPAQTIDELLRAQGEILAGQQRSRDSMARKAGRLPPGPELRFIATHKFDRMRMVCGIHRFADRYVLPAVDGKMLYSVAQDGRLVDSQRISTAPESPRSVAGRVQFATSSSVSYKGNSRLLLFPPGTPGIENTDAVLIDPARPEKAPLHGSLIPLYREILRQSGLDARELMIEAAAVMGHDILIANHGDRTHQWIVLVNCDSLLSSVFGRGRMPVVRCVRQPLDFIAFTPLSVMGMMPLDRHSVLATASADGNGGWMNGNGSQLIELKWEPGANPVFGQAVWMADPALREIAEMYEGIERLGKNSDGSQDFRGVVNSGPGGVILVDMKYLRPKF